LSENRLSDLRDFYSLLEALSHSVPARTLVNCSGRIPWPDRGVYFFMESGETRSDSGTGPRIVRVGTHALKDNSSTRLWTRLSQHRGRTSSGRGNHRGSIFRLIVGTSLIARRGSMCPTWGIGNNAPAEARAKEEALEREVSAVIGAMPSYTLRSTTRLARRVSADSSNAMRLHFSATSAASHLIHQAGIGSAAVAPGPSLAVGALEFQPR
jgi:hypothetical protein